VEDALVAVRTVGIQRKALTIGSVAVHVSSSPLFRVQRVGLERYSRRRHTRPLHKSVHDTANLVPRSVMPCSTWGGRLPGQP
jgi:hypothetical protein